MPTLAGLQAAHEGLTGKALIGAMVEEFRDKIAVVSSFGSESAVLLDLVAQVDPSVPVIFLETGKLFGETLRYRDQLAAHLGLTDVRSLRPDGEDEARLDPKGVLWAQDPDACCALRKVRPMQQALAGFDAWFTGRKRFQAATRAELPVIEAAGPKFKINPLIYWGIEDLQAYMAENNIPAHPLVDDGYVSIGCMPCTDRVEEGEDYRDGRWRGKKKTECGIHTAEMFVDGGGI